MSGPLDLTVNNLMVIPNPHIKMVYIIGHHKEGNKVIRIPMEPGDATDLGFQLLSAAKFAEESDMDVTGQPVIKE